MTAPSFSTSFAVDASPAEVFAAITNVRGWWSEETEGDTATLGSEFKYHYRDVHTCTMRITEAEANRRVAWLVLDNHFDFTQDKSEWVNTRITFDIAEQDGQTVVRFGHQGLVPDYECFELCSSEWGRYINGSLRDLITTGKGQPNPVEAWPASA